MRLRRTLVAKVSGHGNYLGRKDRLPMPVPGKAEIIITVRPENTLRAKALRKLRYDQGAAIRSRKTHELTHRHGAENGYNSSTDTVG